MRKCRWLLRIMGGSQRSARCQCTRAHQTNRYVVALFRFLLRVLPLEVLPRSATCEANCWERFWSPHLPFRFMKLVSNLISMRSELVCDLHQQVPSAAGPCLKACLSLQYMRSLATRAGSQPPTPVYPTSTSPSVTRYCDSFVLSKANESFFVDWFLESFHRLLCPFCHRLHHGLDFWSFNYVRTQITSPGNTGTRYQSHVQIMVVLGSWQSNMRPLRSKWLLTLLASPRRIRPVGILEVEVSLVSLLSNIQAHPSPYPLTTFIEQSPNPRIIMLFQNVVVALSLAAVSMARVSKPQIRSEGAVCFDAGDCILVCSSLYSISG